MTDEPTAAEKALSAEAARLKKEAAQQAGSALDAVLRIVPVPVLLVVAAVWVGGEAFKYWQGVQLADAQVAQQRAQQSLEDAKARAATARAPDGETLRLKKAKAELAKQQSAAAVAATQAAAYNAELGGKKARLAQVQAEAALKAQQAREAEVKYLALAKQTGALTLADRAEQAQYAITQLEAADERMGAALNNAAARPGWNSAQLNLATVRGLCVDNPYARPSGCPRNFINKEPPLFDRNQRQAEASQGQTGGGSSGAATATPQKAPVARGPSFECSTVRFPDEIAICQTPTLAALDLQTTAEWQAAKERNHDDAMALARAFIKTRRACKDDIACIERAQRNMISRYKNVRGFN